MGDNESATTAGHPFNDADADLILHTCDNTEFRVHKLIMSLASPIFMDMFTLGQSHASANHSESGTTKPQAVVSITEDSVVIDRLLRFCYPVADPVVPLEGVCGVMEAARKYDIGFIEQALEKMLHEAKASHPLQVYAIAARFGSEDLAAGAAKCFKKTSKFLTKNFYLAESFDETLHAVAYIPEMDHIPAGSYFRLLKFLYQGSLSEPEVATPFLTNSILQMSKEQATHPLALPYHSKQADIVIRSRDGVDSYVNSTVLSLAAPGLASAISESQTHPKDRSSNGLCIVPLPEHHDALYLLLCHSHFQLLPSDLTLDQIVSLLQVATKYGANSALEEGKRLLRSHIPREPLLSYFWAAQLGLEEEARVAAIQCACTGWEDEYSKLEDFDAILYYAFCRFQHAYCHAVCRATSSKRWAWSYWKDNRTPFKGGDPFGTYGREVIFALMVDVEENSRDWMWFWSNFRTLASKVESACSKVCHGPVFQSRRCD